MFGKSWSPPHAKLGIAIVLWSVVALFLILEADSMIATDETSALVIGIPSSWNVSLGK